MFASKELLTRKQMIQTVLEIHNYLMDFQETKKQLEQKMIIKILILIDNALLIRRALKDYKQN